MLLFQKAVVDLMEAGRIFYIVFTDNWYTFPLLFHFQSQKTGAVGTARTNRCHMLRDQEGKILCLSWMDMKLVTRLTAAQALAMVQARFEAPLRCIIQSRDESCWSRRSTGLLMPFSEKVTEVVKKAVFYLHGLATVNTFSVYKLLRHRVV